MKKTILTLEPAQCLADCPALTSADTVITGIIQGMGSAFVTHSLIGRAHSQNDPWTPKRRITMHAQSTGRSSVHKTDDIMITSPNRNIPALLALCAGNSPVTDEIPSLRPVTRSFDIFFHLRMYKRLSKQS